MTEETYRAHPALNYSLAKHLLDSPWHFQAALVEDVQETLDMTLGSMLHETFLMNRVPEYVLRPEANEEGDPWQGNKKWCRAWKKERKDAGIIVFDDKAEARQVRMAESLRNNRTFQAMLEHSKAKEEPIIGEYRGVQIKGKLDLWGRDKNDTIYLADLKKCRSASPRGFANRRADGRLSMQAEWYSTLLSMKLGLEQPPVFVWIAIEDSFAAPVETYLHGAESQRIGRQQMDAAIDAYKRGMETGEWPSYTAGLTEVQTFPWENVPQN